MIAARQELDLRPQLERLDALLLRSAGVDPASLTFSFRPLWQLSAEEAQVALQKAQATAVYAGLKLWPASVTAALVRAQLIEDGGYPNAAAILGGAAGAANDDPASTDPEWVQSGVADYSPDQPRDPQGRWTEGGQAFPTGPLPGSSVINAMIGVRSSTARPTRIAGEEEEGTGETPSQRDDVQHQKEQKKLHETIEHGMGLMGTSAGESGENMKIPLPVGAGAPAARSTAPLQRLHPDATYKTDFGAKRSLEFWRSQSTNDIVNSLQENKKQPLLVTSDGRIMNGNTRIKVLQERGFPVDTLPRVLHGH